MDTGMSMPALLLHAKKRERRIACKTLCLLCLHAAVQSVDSFSVHGLIRADFHIIGLAFLKPGYGLGEALAADGSFDDVLGKLLIRRAAVLPLCFVT